MSPHPSERISRWWKEYNWKIEMCLSILWILQLEIIKFLCKTSSMQKNIIILSKYVLLVFTGILLLVLCSTIQHTKARQPGEYYYSSFLRNNYTVLSACLFLIVGLGIGYFFKLNPWFSGICLILIFPIVRFYEATIYRGSHNLIPLELIVYFLFALPGILGVYLGNFIFKRTAISKH